MKLPTPGRSYDVSLMSQAFAAIAGEFRRMRPKGADLELGPHERLIVTTPNGSRRRLVVSDTGAVTTEPL